MGFRSTKPGGYWQTSTKVEFVSVCLIPTHTTMFWLKKKKEEFSLVTSEPLNIFTTSGPLNILTARYSFF
jgi:hypothetical protein